jgi:hypothetical protein
MGTVHSRGQIARGVALNIHHIPRGKAKERVELYILLPLLAFMACYKAKKLTKRL